jgi:hypothetical protein
MARTFAASIKKRPAWAVFHDCAGLAPRIRIAETADTRTATLTPGG